MIDKNYKKILQMIKRSSSVEHHICLQDILILLKNNNINPFISYGDESNIATLSFFPPQSINDIISQGGMKSIVLFCYDLTKSLDKQNAQTLEKISDILQQ